MDNKFAIRLARIEDAKKLAEFCELLRKSLDMSVHSDKLLSGVSAPIKDRSKGMYLVATESDNSTLIGCLMITYEWSDVNNGFYWWIQSVYVDPRWRRMGVYSALHNRVINLARSTVNVTRIKLYVHQTNRTAQKTYMSHGMNEAPHKIFELYL